MPDAAVPELTALAKDIKRALAVSTPLISINTPDPAATMRELAPLMGVRPVIRWDALTGPVSMNDARISDAALSAAASAAGYVAKAQLVNPWMFLEACYRLPEDAIVFMLNLHHALDGEKKAEVRQGLWNLRDAFKENGRCVIMLQPSLTPPLELKGDVMGFEQDFPTRAEIERVLLKQHANANVTVPARKILDTAIDALTGIEPFMVEQVSALAVQRGKLDVPFIQQRRCKIIATTKGLSVWQGPETFAIVGGCQTIKSFVAPLITKDIFGGVLWIDEIGDAMRGHASDSSGVGGDQHGVMLSWMADKKIPAILGVGIAGTGKSEFGKALGNEAGRPTIRWDFGGMLGQYVGNSQDYIRNSIKVVEAVTASRPFIIATTNDTQSLSPQLLSRFMAVFYFDLPDREERKAIWKINLDKYGVTGNRLEGYDRLLPLEWTGREIYRCCQMTQLLDMDLDAASQFIVPVSDSQRETISSLRSQANGTWLSASYPGVYKIDRQREPRAAGERRISA